MDNVHVFFVCRYTNNTHRRKSARHLLVVEVLVKFCEKSCMYRYRRKSAPHLPMVPPHA